MKPKEVSEPAKLASSDEPKAMITITGNMWMTTR